jgi:hypothetical protein
MKTHKALMIILVLLIVGCGVPLKEHEQLIKENDSLKNKIETLEIKYNKLIQEKFQLEIEQKKKKFVTESEALGYLKDYYEFYDANNIFRNPKVRRVDKNAFIISLEECLKKGGFSNKNFFWSSTVKKLVVNNDGTYSLKASVQY